MALLPPVINGHRYSWASLEVTIRGMMVIALRSINYSSELTPGIIWGSDPGRVGRTPGRVTHAASVELLRREWDVLREELGMSFGRVPFDVSVQYADEGEAVVTDWLIGCRITRVEMNNSDSTDATAVALTLDPYDIRQGGRYLSIEERDSPIVNPFPEE
jgi:hypothetical protein